MATIQLYGNLGISNSYESVFDFASETEQNYFFDSRGETFNNVNFNKFQNKLKLDMQYTDAIKVTYMRYNWVNADSSNKYFYYFITDVEVISANETSTTVQFTLEEDVYQTYMFDFSLGMSSINRAHVDRWGSGTNPIRVSPVRESITAIRKTEGETKIKDVKTYQSSSGTTKKEICWVVVNVMAETGPDEGVIAHRDSKYYCYPIEPPQPGNLETRIILQSDLPVVPLDMYARRVLPSAYDALNNALQYYMGIPSESLLGVYILPNLNLECYHYYTDEFTSSVSVSGVNGACAYHEFPMIFGHDANWSYVFSMFEFSESDLFTQVNTVRPSNLNEAWSLPTKPTNGQNNNMQFEPALFMYPFTERFVCAGNGAVLKKIEDNVIMNEQTQWFKNQAVLSESGIAQRITVNPSLTAGNGIDGRSVESKALSCVTLTDAWLNYRLTTRDTDRAILANNVINQSAQSILSMGTGGALVGARGNGGASVAGGMAMGVGGSVVGSVINAMTQYANQDLKEQQIRNQCSSLISASNAFGEIPYGNIYNLFAYSKVDDVTMELYYNIFRRYGYAIDGPSQPNIRSRKYFNYIKTNGANIIGSLNSKVKAKLQAIFDSGVTIWHTDYTPFANIQTNTMPIQENIERTLI